MYKNRKEEIKEALRQGGLIVSGRNSGKTIALVELLLEDKRSMVLVSSLKNSKHIHSMLMENGLTKDEADRKIVTIQNVEMRAGYSTSFPSKYLYIDNWLGTDYRGPFKAAVTSFPFKIKVLE